jgi:hypothetical protein
MEIVQRRELQNRILAHWGDYNKSASSLGRRKRGPTDEVRRAVKRTRVALQGSEFSGQSRLTLVNEDGTTPTLAARRPAVNSTFTLDIEAHNVSKWTNKWVNTAKFLVSRRKNTQLWDITRGWNTAVWNAYMEREGLRRPFDPLYEGIVFVNEEDE